MAEAYIFSVTENDFDQSVIDNSNKIPVFALFLGYWSGPSLSMAQRLEKLAGEFPEQFIFAKIDIDEQPELRKRFKVVNVPTLKIFSKGNVDLELEGEMTEKELRQVLRGLMIMHPSDVEREKAQEAHGAGRSAEAIGYLVAAAKAEPGNGDIALDMVHIFLDIGEFSQAKELYSQLPGSVTDSEDGKLVKGRLFFANKASEFGTSTEVQARFLSDKGDTGAHFAIALYLIAQNSYQLGLQQLLTLVEVAPEWNEGAAHNTLVLTIEMLKDNVPELSKTYRTLLANLMN